MGADAPPGLDLPAAPTNVVPDNLSTFRNASVRNTTRLALIAAAIVPELIIFSRPTGGVLIPHAVGWWVPFVQHYRTVASVVATFMIAATVFGWSSLRRFVADEIESQADGSRNKFLALHLASVACFAIWAERVAWSGRLEGEYGWRWFLFGAALFLAALVTWFLALFPAEAWLRWIRGNRSSVAGAIATAALTQILRLQALSLWQPLTIGTLWCVEVLLRLLGQTTVFKPEITLVGTPAFAVTVLPSCSGVEGIGIVTAFVGAYLWFCRRDLRFPAAILLLPAAAISSWLLNVVRITALIFIGGWSERVAIRGFHTVAGWLMCTVATCAMVVASRRMPAFSRAEVQSRAAVVPNPAAMYLMPLLAILLIAMLSSIAAASFDFAYPLRVVGAATVLWFYRDKLMEFSRPTSFSFSLFAVMLGAVAFVEWIVLEPDAAAVSENHAFAAGISAMRPTVAATWLSFRVAGAIVTVPIAEELAFRGYLLRKLVSADFERVDFKRFTWLSFAVSSALFGMMHREWLAGAIAGMLFAAAMYRRGALFDAVVAHSTANALLAAYVLTTHRWSLWN